MTVLWSDKDWKVMLESASLPDGREKEAIRVKRPDSVHIIAFIHSNNILILREYRPYYGTYIWMLPSGKVDKEKNMEAAAQRELREETGYKASELKEYCTVHNSESVISANHIFIAKGLEKDPLPQDDDEEIEVHELPVEEALQKVLESEYVHTPSAYALLHYLKFKKT